jgi:hypothetical protein
MAWLLILLLVVLNKYLEEFNSLLVNITLIILLLELFELVLIFLFIGIYSLG